MSQHLAALPEVPLAARDFQAMLQFASDIFVLKRLPDYQAYIRQQLPDSAMLGPTDEAILMGFDFHLTDDGPKLIEINNNAGGLYGSTGWLPQPSLQDATWLRNLATMFPEHWQSVAIVDEDIGEQYMYPEMQAYATLLREQGRRVVLCSPQELELHEDGLYAHGMRLDGIYNRHTDFYLEDDSMHHIRDALLQGLVDINPFPRSYALLGDKERMADWWQPGLLEQWLTKEQCQRIRRVVPETRRMGDYASMETIWAERKQWVFKPPRSHAGKGVVPGRGISRRRFASLIPEETLLQRYVPASSITTTSGDTFRMDIRLYMHGARLVALAARLWRGQVTNFRERGSGWAAVRVQTT